MAVPQFQFDHLDLAATVAGAGAGVGWVGEVEEEGGAAADHDVGVQTALFLQDLARLADPGQRVLGVVDGLAVPDVDDHPLAPAPAEHVGAPRRSGGRLTSVRR
ncbi:hypothetical protein [Streptomyces sp. NBC_00459]|uniref:hypothetical protein n=1 Tax=Streptomyces sp. NBC_00459 TaxID=2975749 RepID=UPI002E16C5CF